MTLSGIEPVTFQFVTQHTVTIPNKKLQTMKINCQEHGNNSKTLYTKKSIKLSTGKKEVWTDNRNNVSV